MFRLLGKKIIAFYAQKILVFIKAGNYCKHIFYCRRP